MPGKTGHVIPLSTEDVILITDKKNPRYDPRIELPVSEELINNVYANGVRVPLSVIADGPRWEIIDGRQRYRALLEANKRRAKAGLPPLKLKAIPTVIDDDGAAADLRESMNIRVESPPTMKAEAARHMLEKLGKSEAQVCLAMGVSITTLRALLRLFDCTKTVRDAVDAGRIGVRTAAADIASKPRDEQDAALAELAGEDHAGPTNGHANGRRKPRTDKTKSGRPPMGTLSRLAAHEFEGDDPLKKVTGRELLACVVGEVKLVDLLADHPRLKGAFEKR